MSDPRELVGRVAVVTGGASGIGRGLAEAFLAGGATVVIADIEDAPLRATAADLGVTGIRTDVTDIQEVRSLADAVVERFGRVDILCNNAGVGHLAPFASLTVDDFRWLIDVNLMGVVHGASVFLPILSETSDSGWIVNTASMAGLFDAPGMAAYSASKFAVVAFTETIAQELELAESSVRISTLLPGLVETRITDSERNRPGGARTAPVQLDQIPPGRTLLPGAVGELVRDSYRERELYIVTHPEMLPLVRNRHARVEAAFRAAD